MTARAPAPLRGARIVVTRPRAQADDLVRPLERRGATVVLFPTIRIVPPSDPRPLMRAVREAASYDWLVFTSVNGVEAFGRALEEEGVDLGAGAANDRGVRVCAIGPATGAALEAIGLRARVMPEEFVAEAVVEALAGEEDIRGARILLPRAAVARAALPDGLREKGARVDVVEAYRSVPASGDTGELLRMLRAGEVDLVTFTASSTVSNFHRALDEHRARGEALGSVPPADVRVAAIGPITAATARELGYDVVVVAEEYTIPGLVRGVEGYFAEGGRSPS